LLVWSIFLVIFPNTFIRPTLIGLFYFLVFLSIFSTTPGKALLGLKVIAAKKIDKMKVWRAIGRTLSYGVSFLTGGLGFLFIAFDKKKQGFHDKLAGTLVIRDTTKNLSARILLSIIVVIITFILAIALYRYSFNSYLIKHY